MTYEERQRKKKKMEQARQRQMHREINTKSFELAFKIWCAFHPHCQHCQFRKAMIIGCVELYYRKYYHPELWKDDPDDLPF